MRRPAGIAGATLIYGPRDRFPDMILALQFLLDDLRRDGRQVSGVRLSGHTLRLRVEDFELAASIAAEPLPIAVFNGVLRPAQVPVTRSEWTHDLARGRLLHAIRHHRWALGVLLRARWGTDGGNSEEDLDLRAECRSVVAALVEASPPQFILWQSSGVLFTLAEFQNLSPPRLNAPGDPRTAMHPKPPPASPIPRPANPGAGLPGNEAASAGENAVEGHRTEECGEMVLASTALAPQRSRLDRMLQRSAGRLFRRNEGRQGPPEHPGPDRSHRRLARAFGRGAQADESDAPKRAPSRRVWLLGCALMAVSLAIILPPWTGV